MSYSVKSKNVFLQVEVPLEIGGVKVTAVNQLVIYLNDKGKKKWECEVLDYTDISFMGLPVESGYDSFQNFKSHLKGMGVDICSLIEKENDKILTKSVLGKIALGTPF